MPVALAVQPPRRPRSIRQDASEDVNDVAAAPPVALPSATMAPASDFMAGIRVQRMGDGRLVLEAKPEAAAAFAAMLEGVAALLKQVTPSGAAGK